MINVDSGTVELRERGANMNCWDLESTRLGGGLKSLCVPSKPVENKGFCLNVIKCIIRVGL